MEFRVVGLSRKPCHKIVSTVMGVNMNKKYAHGNPQTCETGWRDYKGVEECVNTVKIYFVHVHICKNETHQSI